MPTYFTAFIKNLIETISRLQKEIVSHIEKFNDLLSKYELLQTRNKELEAMLKSNSKNSHKPPSTDMFKSKSPLTGSKGDKKQGGQPGHKGKTLEFTSNPDKTINLVPTATCCCGADLNGVNGTIEESRQVFDLPQPKLEITQYNKIGFSCPHCGIHHCGVFPTEVTAYVQYGSGVRAYAVLLNNSIQASYNKTSQLMYDMYGYYVNVSTLITANEQCYTNLETTEINIKEAVIESEVVHFDETGLQVEKERHWMHTACTSSLTYLFVSKYRGAKAIGSPESVIPYFNGWAVHDCWATYFTFHNCRHVLCGAHLLRELQALIEEGNKWAKMLKDFLMDLYLKTNKGRGKIEDFTPFSLNYDEICRYADINESKPPPKTNKTRGKTKQTKGRNLLDRFVKYKSAVLAFAQNEEVPFTNNQAERDVRPCKTKQKISNCFRTVEGANIYARIQGFISTVRKQEQNVFDMIKLSFTPNFKYELKKGSK